MRVGLMFMIILILTGCEIYRIDENEVMTIEESKVSIRNKLKNRYTIVTSDNNDRKVTYYSNRTFLPGDNVMIVVMPRKDAEEYLNGRLYRRPDGK